MEAVAEKAIDAAPNTAHALTYILAVVACMMALHIIKWFLEIAFDWGKEEKKQSDQSRVDIIRLEYEMKSMKDDVQKLLGLSQDTLAAVRILAGDQWHEVVKKIKDGELHRR